MLQGEGNYALTSVKEIDGTEAFLSLDDDIKLCQNEETLADCSTKDFMKRNLDLCKCVPYKLRNFSKQVYIFIWKYILYYYFQDRVCLYPNW